MEARLRGRAIQQLTVRRPRGHLLGRPPMAWRLDGSCAPARTARAAARGSVRLRRAERTLSLADVTSRSRRRCAQQVPSSPTRGERQDHTIAEACRSSACRSGAGVAGLGVALGSSRARQRGVRLLERSFDRSRGLLSNLEDRGGARGRSASAAACPGRGELLMQPSFLANRSRYRSSRGCTDIFCAFAFRGQFDVPR